MICEHGVKISKRHRCASCEAIASWKAERDYEISKCKHSNIQFRATYDRERLIGRIKDIGLYCTECEYKLSFKDGSIHGECVTMSTIGSIKYTVSLTITEKERYD